MHDGAREKCNKIHHYYCSICMSYVLKRQRIQKFASKS
jgi:hypothetical protein